MMFRAGNDHREPLTTLQFSLFKIVYILKRRVGNRTDNLYVQLKTSFPLKFFIIGLIIKVNFCSACMKASPCVFDIHDVQDGCHFGINPLSVGAENRETAWLWPPLLYEEICHLQHKRAAMIAWLPKHEV